MSSPRKVLHVFVAAAAAVLIAGSVLALPADATPAGHRHHAPKLINYAKHGSLGVQVRPNGGMNRLHGAPASLKTYIRSQFKVLLKWEPASQRAACKNAPLIIVAKYRTDGWAFISDAGDFPGHGAPGSCATGGSYGLWHAKKGHWRHVLAGQDLPTCGKLTRLKAPTNVWGLDCFRGSHEVLYRLGGPAHNSPACSAHKLFLAAAHAEGFNPNDPSYATMTEKATAYDAHCYDGWAVAAVSRPNVGTTDGTTLFGVSNGAWYEHAEIGAAMPCTLTPQGVSAADIKHLGAIPNSPVYCPQPG